MSGERGERGADPATQRRPRADSAPAATNAAKAASAARPDRIARLGVVRDARGALLGGAARNTKDVALLNAQSALVALALLWMVRAAVANLVPALGLLPGPPPGVLPAAVAIQIAVLALLVAGALRPRRAGGAVAAGGGLVVAATAVVGGAAAFGALRTLPIYALYEVLMSFALLVLAIHALRTLLAARRAPGALPR